MENNFSLLINNAITEDCLVAIYADRNNPYDCNVGYIIKNYEGLVLQRSVSTNGFQDGYILMSFDDIFLVELDTIYLNNIKLCTAGNREERRVADPLLDESKGLLRGVLEHCRTHQNLITIRMYGKTFMGFVHKIDGRLLQVKNVNSEGLYDGISYMQLSDIKSLSFGGLDEKRIMQLIKK